MEFDILRENYNFEDEEPDGYSDEIDDQMEIGVEFED